MTRNLFVERDDLRDRYSVPGSAWDETFQKLSLQLRVSKQSFGRVRSQAERSFKRDC